jgi:phospholipid/cholesterol/gamma-HCH transport system substrate-binding protein
MDKRRSELRVGIVVFLAIALLFTGVIWVKGYRFGQKFKSVMISFPDVGALRSGDQLAVSGVAVGKVKTIELVSGKVVVTCSIDQTIFLGQDARFSVKNIGLMGERFVAVDAGTSSVALDLTKVHDGRFDTGIPEVMGMMGDMVSEVRQMVNLIGNTVASEGSLGEFQATISQLHDLSVKLNEVVDDSRDGLKRSLAAVERASTSLDQLVKNNRERADSAVADFADASDKLNRLTGGLDTLALSLREFADKLNSEEGSLGLLASDRSLYDDVKKAVREVDNLVVDIKTNPKKYLSVEFKLF